MIKEKKRETGAPIYAFQTTSNDNGFLPKKQRITRPVNKPGKPRRKKKSMLAFSYPSFPLMGFTESAQCTSHDLFGHVQ
jgi:hypothetical protein